MKIKLPDQKDRLEVVELASSGGVAAGRTVPFPVPDDTLYVPLTPREAAIARTGLISHMTVFGDSLRDVGIHDGDSIVVQQITDRREIKDKTICIVLIRHSGDPVAKRVRYRPGMVTLKACNSEVPDVHLNPDEVEVQAKLIGLYRKADKNGSFTRSL